MKSALVVEGGAMRGIFAAGVLLALIFGGILTYSRDYIINFIATSVEARNREA